MKLNIGGLQIRLSAQKLHQWQDWKFGRIIHWGHRSRGASESRSSFALRRGLVDSPGPFADDYYKYKAAYEEIRKSFNPGQVQPEHWAEAAGDAGMK